MEICFIGYSELNFDTKDGSHIEGVKFSYMYPSDNPHRYGNDVGEIFVNISKPDLCRQIREAKVGGMYRLNMGYNGRKAIFLGLIPVSAS